MTEINIEKLTRDLIDTFLNAGKISINLRKAGLTQQQARQLYTAAQRELPRLRDIQSRQDSGEQQLTIEEFTQAVVFQDPDQLENIRRLEAEEESMFSPVGGAAREGGRVTGLVEG